MDDGDGVWCEDCDNVHPDTLQKPEESWRCLAVPMLAGIPGVTRRRIKAYDPPYALCRYVNGQGDCEHFKPKRQPPTEDKKDV